MLEMKKKEKRETKLTPFELKVEKLQEERQGTVRNIKGLTKEIKDLMQSADNGERSKVICCKIEVCSKKQYI